MLRKITKQRIQWDVKLRHGKHRALKEGYLTPGVDWALVISLCRDSFAVITEFVTKWCLSTWQTAPMEPDLVCVPRGISKSTENRMVEWDSFHQLSWPTFWTDNQFSWNNLCSWAQLFLFSVLTSLTGISITLKGSAVKCFRKRNCTSCPLFPFPKRKLTIFLSSWRLNVMFAIFQSRAALVSSGVMRVTRH